MSVQRWMLRALKSERRARKAERRAELAERIVSATIKRLTDEELLQVREEIRGGGENERTAE